MNEEKQKYLGELNRFFSTFLSFFCQRITTKYNIPSHPATTTTTMNSLLPTVRGGSLARRGASVSRALLPSPTYASSRRYATEGHRSESAKDKAAVGPFNLRAGLLFLVTGAGLLFYFQNEKAKVAERKRQETATAKVGRPRIGGPFSLVTSTSHPFTHEDLLGSFTLVYFGFTNCPDICPEELDKMGEVVDRIDGKYKQSVINPVFISCDPARDNVAQLARYIDDFHPKMVGLTGTFDAVKSACKAYRVYFSTPPNADPTSDYLVDHSIFFYLMDPEGKFVDAFGRSVDAQEVGDKVDLYVQQWLDAKLPISPASARQKAQTDGRAPVQL